MKFSQTQEFWTRWMIASLLLASIGLNGYLLYQQRTAIKAFVKSFLLKRRLYDTGGTASNYSNTPFVYYAFRDQVETIPPSASRERGSDLPQSLIITPGRYRFSDHAYELRKEGLYRFVYPEKENQQRIVYSGNVDAILSGVAWIYSHGNSDDNKSFTEISTKAMTSKIFATCGGVSSWILKVLESNGTKARVVQTLTLDPWNNYDNGHVLIEVYRNDSRKWAVYDLDNNVYFTHHRIPLSLIELVNHIEPNDYRVERMASDSVLDVSNFIDRSSGYDYAFVMERIAADEQSLREWYKRAIQVPMIEDGNLYYFFEAAHRSQIESYSEIFRYIDKQRFMEKFYS